MDILARTQRTRPPGTQDLPELLDVITAPTSSHRLGPLMPDPRGKSWKLAIPPLCLGLGFRMKAFVPLLFWSRISVPSVIGAVRAVGNAV